MPLGTAKLAGQPRRCQEVVCRFDHQATGWGITTSQQGLWLALLVAAVAQVVIALVWTPTSAGYLQWWHLLTG